VRFFFSFGFLRCIRVCLDDSCLQMKTVNAARSDPPTPRARAPSRAAQRREQEWAARAKEKKVRWWERLEQYNEEYRLCEQQGLSLCRRRRTRCRTRRRKVMGSGPPPIGGNPRPCRNGLKERPWNWSPWQARKRPPPGYQWRCQQAPRRCQWVRRRSPPSPQGRGSRDSPI
jgi:hypothetical protein